MTIGSASEDEGVVFSELKFPAVQRPINNLQPDSVLHITREAIGGEDQLQ